MVVVIVDHVTYPVPLVSIAHRLVRISASLPLITVAVIVIEPVCHGASVPIVQVRVVGTERVESDEGLVCIGVLPSRRKKSNGKRSYTDTLYAVPDELFE